MGDSSLFSSSSSSSFSGSCSFLGSSDAESDLCDSSTLSLPGRGIPRFFCELVSGEEANLGRRRRHFLDACFLCKRPIRGASDVFMYGGDAPFCSEECRQEQMEMDEALERCRHLRPSSSSSSSTMTRAAARKWRHHHFLDACFLCKRPIRGVSDVFMYGGDAPFCSEECREEQVEMDEALERCRRLPSSSSSMTHAAPSVSTSVPPLPALMCGTATSIALLLPTSVAS